MSYEQICDDCHKEFTASGDFCPFCGVPVDGDSSTIERRVTITEAPDGGLLVGEREIVEKIDDVCSELESLQDDVDNPQAKAALRAAIGNAWRASVLHRVAENSDIRMVTDTGSGKTSVLGPETDGFTRECGEKDV
ncbi:hypothetical protein [Natrinema salaciae]|uniref:Zinc ribbon domain-containing protein n=1 Tax=Natrinema salaciae TaxID=1186196 RepID=A0A1H9ES94_9EURY|nr:hypothetical protein [Natrinema salaciae]SEQ28485.1 hypothetical protein SAMN04489841_1368 [Natrinema salaciae]